MSLAEEYIEGLKQAYIDQDAEEQWDKLERAAVGVSPENLEKLRAAYPDIPETLVELLKRVDGTWCRQYGSTIIDLYFLGSPELEEYPYYLLSAEEMLEPEEDWFWLSDLISLEAEGCEIDEKINRDEKQLHWLHFANCMNNGGSSRLYLDFSPSDKGVKGQVVCYVHDPDELVVVADSFDEYLQILMDSDYDFINEDTVEPDEDDE